MTAEQAPARRADLAGPASASARARPHHAYTTSCSSSRSPCTRRRCCASGTGCSTSPSCCGSSRTGNEIWGPDSPWTPGSGHPAVRPDRVVQHSHPVRQSGCTSRSATRWPSSRVHCSCSAGGPGRCPSLFAVVVASFHARAIFMTDGGDNLMLLMAIYLVLHRVRPALVPRRAQDPAPRSTAGAQAGDTARRARPPAPTRRRPPICDHGAAQLRHVRHRRPGLLPLRIRGPVQGAGRTQWANGTALHYVLNLDLFRPWPDVVPHDGRPARCWSPSSAI